MELRISPATARCYRPGPREHEASSRPLREGGTGCAGSAPRSVEAPGQTHCERLSRPDLQLPRPLTARDRRARDSTPVRAGQYTKSGRASGRTGPPPGGARVAATRLGRGFNGAPARSRRGSPRRRSGTDSAPASPGEMKLREIGWTCAKRAYVGLPVPPKARKLRAIATTIIAATTRMPCARSRSWIGVRPTCRVRLTPDRNGRLVLPPANASDRTVPKTSQEEATWGFST